jgi:hypothetical protein
MDDKTAAFDVDATGDDELHALLFEGAYLLA